MNITPVLKPSLMYKEGKAVKVTDDWWNTTCPVLLEQLEEWQDNDKVRNAFANVLSNTFGPSTTADLMMYAGIDHGVIAETIARLLSEGHHEVSKARRKRA